VIELADCGIESRENCNLLECRAWWLCLLGGGEPERLFPQSANWFVIVRCVSRHRQPVVPLARNDHSIADFPLRNFESRDPKRLQARPQVIGPNAKIFAGYARGASLL